MAGMKTLLILTLLFGDFGTPPTPAKELSAAHTEPICESTALQRGHRCSWGLHCSRSLPKIMEVLVFLILSSLVHVSECQAGGDSIQFNSTTYSPVVFDDQPVGTYVVTISA